MEPEVFTPLTASGQRMSIPLADVHVLTGELWQRGPGLHATVEIRGSQYRVYGRACDLPGCYCDALIVDAR